jgi:hypothetical protein
MGCSCKDNRREIEDGKKLLAEFREMFIRRMTVDSEHHDRQKKDFNQAIFSYREDGSTYAVWSETDMEMVLRCFDDAIKDWRNSFCDVDGCTRRR